jgi:diguanylate cyclase (GGDEF)-like protein
MKKLRVSSPGLLMIIAIAAGGGIFLLDMCYLQPQLREHEQVRLRERAGAAQATTQLSLHVEEDRLAGLCRAWRREPAIRDVLVSGGESTEAFEALAQQQILQSEGEQIWLTDQAGNLLAAYPAMDDPYRAIAVHWAHRRLQDPQGRPMAVRQGMMDLGDDAAVFASGWVFGRRGGGQAFGRLWIARRLDHALLARGVAAIEATPVFIPADGMPVGTVEEDSAAHVSWPGDGDRLMVAWPANDLAGKMLGYFRADVPVTGIYRQTATVRKLVLGILVLSAGVMLLLITGTHILIAGPIVRLLARLRSFEAGKITTRDFSKKLHGESRLLADELESAFNRLATMSQTDPLTGLANRGHFERVLDTCYHQAVRYQRPLSVIAMDVDFFKDVNDTHGHQAGDAALIALAEALKTACRRADLAGRIGGDKFCIIMPETGAHDAAVVAERLRQLMAEAEIPSREADKQLTLSIGIADVTASQTTRSDELLDLADQALYAAKAQGRNRLVQAAELTGATPEPALAAQAD